MITPISTNGASPLVGRWRLVRADKEAPDQTGVTLTFDEYGGLMYEIKSQGKTQRINLTYQIENNWLITDQPSHPRVERTHFQITPLGELILEFEGLRSWYQKL